MLKKLTLIYLSLYVSCSYAAEKNLPEILNFYPACAYEVIKESKTTRSGKKRDDPRVIERALNRLREKAKEAGADALILKNKTTFIDKSKTHRVIDQYGHKTYKVTYYADFIKTCESENQQEVRLTPYDSDGIAKKLSIDFGRITRTKMEFKPPEAIKLRAPEVGISNVSINSGIYGVALGSSYFEVIERLGDPSVEVTILEAEKVVGYGRRHWFHFQNNKLMKVQSRSEFLSSDSLNMIPLRNFFDDSKWKINNLVRYNDPIDKVRTSLNTTNKLNANNQLVLKKNNKKLTLQFENILDLETDEPVVLLKFFTLEMSSYQTSSFIPKSSNESIYDLISDSLKSLIQGKPVGWQKVEKNLGQPLAKIALSSTEKLHIFNNNLLVKTEGARLSEIRLIEAVFTKNLPHLYSTEPWYLGPFKQGESSKKLASYFTEDAFIFYPEVSMEAEEYFLNLMFEEVEDGHILYEAKLDLLEL